MLKRRRRLLHLEYAQLPRHPLSSAIHRISPVRESLPDGIQQHGFTLAAKHTYTPSSFARKVFSV